MFHFNMLIFKHLFFLMPSCTIQSCQLLVCEAKRESCTNHNIWHTLQHYICLMKQLWFLHSSSLFTQVLCWHHFLRIVLLVETVSRRLVPTLYVVWHVALISCHHAALTQTAMCGKALIMALVQIWDALGEALSFVQIVQLQEDRRRTIRLS